MRKSTLRCYCSAVIKVMAYESEGPNREFIGCCARCTALGKFYVDPEEEKKRRQFVADQNAFDASVKGAKRKKR